MARNDSSQVAQLLQPDCQDKTPTDQRAPTPPGAEPAPSTHSDKQTKEDSHPALTSCCPLGDLRRISRSASQKPLEVTATHTVLVHVSYFNRNEAIVPYQGRTPWASDFVKMPCSPRSVIAKGSSSKSRWEAINEYLSRLAEKSAASVHDVEKAVLKYNPKYKGQWSFEGLRAFAELHANEDVSALFRKIAALALKLPLYLMQGIPLLQQGRSASITLSQVQISCLLANAFLCTFPHRNTTRPSSEYHNYPSINFTRLFGDASGEKMEKLKAIMHYFRVVTDDKIKLEGLVTFERRCLANTDVQRWKCCKEKLNELHVSSEGTIETEGVGMLQVDFANSLVGGGVLSSGLLQEEILFLINPELIVSRLFTERLQDNECLVATGCQQFSSYSGFRDSFRWKGPYNDPTSRDKWARRQRQILAIDAMNFKHEREQYNMRMVTRELNKAYCGFKAQGEGHAVATGKWGCGAFNGDPQLKAVIQLMAAAKARRGLAFFTFKDERLKQGLEDTYSFLKTKGTTVAELYDFLADFCAVRDVSHVNLFDYIRTNLPTSQNISKSLL